MAFFNLTQLGPQNLFKTANTSQDSSVAIPQGSRRPQATLGPSNDLTSSDEGNSTSSQTGKEVRVAASESAPSTSHIATYSSCKANLQHGGSYTKYTERLHKHQRDPKGPMDLYCHPLTTSQMYGWWMSHGEPHKQEWAQGPRHVHVNSEMTRFVDEMSQTNKEFSLY